MQGDSLHARTEQRSQRRADLIRDRYGHHASLVRDLVPGCRRQDEAAQCAALDLHRQLYFWAGQAHAIDRPNPTSEEDSSIMFELHHGLGRRARLVSTCVKVQETNQFLPDSFNDLTRRRTRCSEFRDVVDQTDKVGFLDCCLVVMTVAGRQFGDDEPDNEEAHGGLDIGSMGDGELLVGGSEEVSRTTRWQRPWPRTRTPGCPVLRPPR